MTKNQHSKIIPPIVKGNDVLKTLNL